METSYKHSWSCHTHEDHKVDRCPTKGEGHKQSTPWCWGPCSRFLQWVLKILRTSPEVFKSFGEEGQENTLHQHHACYLVLPIQKDQTKLLAAVCLQCYNSIYRYCWQHFNAIWFSLADIAFGYLHVGKQGKRAFFSCRPLAGFCLHTHFMCKSTQTSLQSPVLQSQYVHLN